MSEPYTPKFGDVCTLYDRLYTHKPQVIVLRYSEVIGQAHVIGADNGLNTWVVPCQLVFIENKKDALATLFPNLPR